MPWLKLEETNRWNHDNLDQQWNIATRNCWALLENIGWKGTDWYHTLLSRYGNDWWTNKGILDLQRDLSALYVFIREWLIERIWEINFRDKNGIYFQVETIMSQWWGIPTFPQMLKDALTAVETDWHEPPADEMQKAKDYFAGRAQKSMYGTMI